MHASLATSIHKISSTLFQTKIYSYQSQLIYSTQHTLHDRSVFYNHIDAAQATNKLEATVPLESCDLLAITETWWDVTGVWLLMATGSPEETGEERERQRGCPLHQEVD